MRSAMRLARVGRRFATEAEYKVLMAQTTELEQLLKSKQPFLAYFTSDTHMALAEGNKLVAEKMAEVNKGPVRLKYLHGDVSRPETQVFMKQLNITQAPPLLAFNNMQLLDTQLGAPDKDFLDNFVSKFLSFIGDGDEGAAGAEKAAGGAEEPELDPESAQGQFAQLVMEIKKGDLAAHTSEALKRMNAIVALAEEEAKEELAERKKNPPKKKSSELPEASPVQLTLANAQLLLADTLHQIEQNDKAWALVEKVKRDFQQYSNFSSVAQTLQTIEMDLVSGYQPAVSAEQLALQVTQTPHDLALQMRLGVALFREGRQKEGVALVLQVLRKDKKLQDGAPKKVLMSMFASLGPKDPITTEGQKKMMSYLF